ncbi:hypothetical protein R84B8_00960 [Treponema sp. R8-4-B8]
MNYTFFELQSQYKILIPKIQRDYAQGREDKNNENKIKSYDFILKIAKVLNNEAPALNLDFVYGYTEKNTENQSAFIPLDGQQRLTTLWLLHWYLSPKKKVGQNGIEMITVADEVKEWLKNFTYETRNSSKRFCEKLIEESLPVSVDVYKEINEASWFMTSWKNDPTVVSMLNMLKTIQEQSFDKEKAWENLVKNRKITFDYIDIKSDEFKLTDELYIKMNSRGRPLTSFDNFKAQISEILSAKETDFVNEKLHYEGREVTYQEYFAFKIDSVWTDLFWGFVIQNIDKIQEKMREDKKIDKNETPISYVFMNFFVFVEQMCYFKDNLGKEIFDFKSKDFSVFKKKDNTLFLFNILDFLYKISLDEDQVKINNINIFFNKLFKEGIVDKPYQWKVRHFDDNEVNLFEKCLLEGNNFENRNSITLFCLASYAIKYDLKEVTIKLIYYIRVIRNLLQATRQRKETVYTPDVRINYFGNYWKLFNQLQEKPNAYERLLEEIDIKGTNITEKALNNEKEKAKIIVDNASSNQEVIYALFMLEDFEHFKGLIHLLKPKDNVSKLINYSKAVNEIWSINNNKLIIAALIACDFGGLYIRNCNFDKWETYIFGKYNTILTYDKDKENENNISFSILKLFDTYLSLTNASASDKIEQIIFDKLNSLEEKDWRYYFLKYYEKMLKNSSYFAWEDDFVIESLKGESSNPLVAYHINPYVATVCLSLDSRMCEENDCKALYSEVSRIILKNKVILTCENDGWHIKMPEGQIIQDELIKKYKITDQNVLSETNGKDRIEIAVDFCNDLYK